MGGYRQVVLQSEDAELICWIANDDRIRRGTIITLKEIDDVRWRVVKVYYYVSMNHPRKAWKVGELV